MKSVTIDKIPRKIKKQGPRSIGSLAKSALLDPRSIGSLARSEVLDPRSPGSLDKTCAAGSKIHLDPRSWIQRILDLGSFWDLDTSLLPSRDQTTQIAPPIAETMDQIKPNNTIFRHYRIEL